MKCLKPLPPLCRIKLNVCAVALALLATPCLLAKNPTQVVVVPVANMYAAPTDKSAVVSQAIYGSNVVLLTSHGEWSKIQTEDHYKGWTPSRYLRLVQSGAGYATAGQTVQVESLFANIYNEPDVARHKPVITIPFESHLAIIAEGKDVTYDMKADRNDPTAVGTMQMADAICRKMQQM